MSQTFNDIHDNNNIIKGEVFQLQNLADAFSITGNTIMAEQLNWIAENIKSSAQKIANAYDNQNADYFKATQKQIGETLSAFAKRGSITD